MRAKEYGGDQIVTFAADMSGRAQEQLDLENELRRAFDNREFTLVYQPVLTTEDRQVTGFEALLRWKHPRRGLLAPDDFLPLAEQLGLMDRITDWVLDRACRQIHDWRQKYDLPLWVAVNFSASAFRSADLLDRIMHTLRQARLAPEDMVVEITENIAMENFEAGVVTLEQLRLSGIRIAIDDFGAGASQIDRIVALKPDIIKLDMRLFKQAARGGLSADVTLAAAAIAERVGCEIVCEGVETVEELHFGIECGARYIQGFVFAPAEPELLPANQPLERVRAVQKYFLERKIDRLRITATHNHQVCDCVMNIKSLLLQDKADSISASELFERGILRYYMCSADGTQISDVMEVERGVFRSQPQYRGSNWSHRPYFPLLLALRSSIARELVVSNSYRDAMSRQLCKTYGTYLNDDRILLVDVAVEDDVLYAPVD
jgi:EAL domain-containing protein (putative c-di-GMP-specific phosphodiesterase class I)